MDDDLVKITKHLLQVAAELEAAILGWAQIQQKIDRQNLIIKELEDTMKGKDKKGKKGC